jgi:serine/threonine protein kinase
MTAPVESNQGSAVSGALLAELVEEITQAIEAGAPVDLDAYLLAFPQHAEELRRLLPAVQALGQLGGSERAAAPGEGQAGTEGQAVGGVLGDFRILRELGRGGMGVVYEAEQISLGRRVALKVLPFAATMDPRQLQRFINEARAAASLEHPHIVPVYGVGSERGVHYYAMKFIDGRTLAECIAERRASAGTGSAEPLRADVPPAPVPPGTDTAPAAKVTTEPVLPDEAFFRRVAEWGVQAAEALEHAHALGVVHRDVKPANLMVDGQGHLWVTDFGLARVGVDAGQTMTGDVLGTLRYMSPEQALAKHGLVDHRADVYALGATLYELLTLRPAFGGSDRQELLRLIAFGEPTAPRRLDRRIPAELETVVLKAMAKLPTDRYATAQELADDLQRFLQGEPIQARRISRLGRFWRWCRRNRLVATLAAVAAALLAMILIGLTVGVVLLGAAYREEAAQRQRAEQAQAREAEQRQLVEQQQKHTKAAQAAETKRLREMELVSEAAMRRLSDLYHRVRDWPAADPRLQPIRSELFQLVLRFYQELAKRTQDDLILSRQAGVAYMEIGDLFALLRRDQEAGAAFRKGIDLWERLARKFPSVPAYRWNQNRCHVRLAIHLMRVGGPHEEVEKSFRRALALAEEVTAQHPKVRIYNEYEPAQSRANLAEFLLSCPDPRFRNPAEALLLARKAVKERPEKAPYWGTLGVALYRTGGYAEALKAMQKVTALKQQYDARDLLYLAMIHEGLGDKEQALQRYKEGAEWIEKQAPNARDLRQLRAEAANQLGIKEQPGPKDKEPSPPRK